MRILRFLIKTIIITIIIFYWTIARHEGSHAVMAYWEGAEINEISLFPGIHEDLGFYFAYVKHSEGTSWLTEAAPYISDILLILITSALLFWKRNIIFFDAIILLGLISPLIDLIYNYQGGLWRSGTDVSDMLELLPKTLVHCAFIVSIVSVILLLRLFRTRRLKTTGS